MVTEEVGGVSVSGQKPNAPDPNRFARALVDPYLPKVERINRSVQEVQKQQERLVKLVAEAKGDLAWCTDLGSASGNPSLQATMDLVPHYAQKAQQCAKDMESLRTRVAKAKEKAVRLARAAEKKSAKAARAKAKATNR